MAASLQNLIDPGAPARLAQMLQGVWPAFDQAGFRNATEPGFTELGLMDRGRRLADGLRSHLPGDFSQAAALLVASMGPPMALDRRGEPQAVPGAPGGFFYLPHSLYLAEHGLAHPEQALAAQHALTQRFTAEFSLRPYLQHHTALTLRHLERWCEDPSAHVRRAASEGTRPRLPWAPRLARFVADPRPALPLLERLRDDPSSYVRRSVANHLNDIGKDHPALLLACATRWAAGAPPARMVLLRHALRTAIKRGDVAALALFGQGEPPQVRVASVSILPARPVIGGDVTVAAELSSAAAHDQNLNADLRVHYVRADGSARPRVFRLGALSLAAQGSQTLRKRLALRQMSTRTHYPGPHRVELLLNGQPFDLGLFHLTP